MEEDDWRSDLGYSFPSLVPNPPPPTGRAPAPEPGNSRPALSPHEIMDSWDRGHTQPNQHSQINVQSNPLYHHHPRNVQHTSSNYYSPRNVQNNLSTHYHPRQIQPTPTINQAYQYHSNDPRNQQNHANNNLNQYPPNNCRIQQYHPNSHHLNPYPPSQYQYYPPRQQPYRPPVVSPYNNGTYPQYLPPTPTRYQHQLPYQPVEINTIHQRPYPINSDASRYKQSSPKSVSPINENRNIEPPKKQVHFSEDIPDDDDDEFFEIEEIDYSNNANGNVSPSSSPLPVYDERNQNQSLKNNDNRCDDESGKGNPKKPNGSVHLSVDVPKSTVPLSEVLSDLSSTKSSSSSVPGKPKKDFEWGRGSKRKRQTIETENDEDLANFLGRTNKRVSATYYAKKKVAGDDCSSTVSSISDDRDGETNIHVLFKSPEKESIRRLEINSEIEVMEREGIQENDVPQTTVERPQSPERFPEIEIPQPEPEASERIPTEVHQSLGGTLVVDAPQSPEESPEIVILHSPEVIPELEVPKSESPEGIPEVEILHSSVEIAKIQIPKSPAGIQENNMLLSPVSYLGKDHNVQKSHDYDLVKMEIRSENPTILKALPAAPPGDSVTTSHKSAAAVIVPTPSGQSVDVDLDCLADIRIRTDIFEDDFFDNDDNQT